MKKCMVMMARMMKPLIGISRDFVCWVVAHKFFCRDSMEALAAKKEIANHGGNL